ncbi:MAG: radical SAM protein [Proteobacteria bacterium]|nr:radical SAM protein [Pseudomonadota bacterium]
MDCQLQSERNKDFILRFHKKLFTDRVPVSGSMELTTRCNFNCVHCYLPESERKGKGQGQELTTKAVLKLIDDMADAGCLNLLFTGGEPLLRNDFSEIYSHSKKKGMIVTVFTNGSTVNDEHIRLFRDLPPFSIEISVYGSSPQTYEKITGVPGSYHHAMAGIDRLHQNGVRIALKTMLMDLNLHELSTMENMARQLGVKFRFDAGITPRLDGDMTPLLRRVPPEDVVALEFQDPKHVQDWKDFWQEQNNKESNERLFVCGAGQTSFHITSTGRLQACIITPNSSCDINNGNFLNGWNEEMIKIRDFKISKEKTCRNCDLISLCGYCPPVFKLETGSQDSCSEFLCRLGHLRHKMIINL